MTYMIRVQRIAHIYTAPKTPVENAALWLMNLLPHGEMKRQIGNRVLSWVVNRHPEASVVADFAHTLGPHPQTIQRLPEYDIYTVRLG